ncbi:hypothetical protein MRS44_005050 [Fusarium solani]|uniref:uncharacterized protein n=1 Tax=Fusarium solani TaxID=169388 RepID=UPI0032C410FB|nr:hypothetical protein MRS44_005050 [Fusarium solani]
MPGFLPARDWPAPLPTIPQAQDPEALARNSKARRGGADTGTIEDTRLYSVWDEWRKRRVDRAGVPGWKAWAGTEDKGSEVTMTSVSETITTTNCPVQDSLESSGAWGRWDGGFVHHGDSGWIMKNERDWSRLNYGGVDGLHKARRSSRSTAQRMDSTCYYDVRTASIKRELEGAPPGFTYRKGDGNGKTPQRSSTTLQPPRVSRIQYNRAAEPPWKR